MNTFSHITQTALCNYLRNHEDDIARSANDYGELRTVFRAMLGRDAEPKPTKSRAQLAAEYACCMVGR